METLYRGLADGQTKGEALRQAQLQFINEGKTSPDTEAGKYAHPFFWAPFFLVGDSSPL